MAKSIQAIRRVYDIVKSSRDNDNLLSDDTIQLLFKSTVDDERLIEKFERFKIGYAAEDLFMRIYSLLPWVKLITPLGQEHLSTVLVEAKLVDGEKHTHEIKKYQLEVLQKYAKEKR